MRSPFSESLFDLGQLIGHRSLRVAFIGPSPLGQTCCRLFLVFSAMHFACATLPVALFLIHRSIHIRTPRSILATFLSRFLPFLVGEARASLIHAFQRCRAPLVRKKCAFSPSKDACHVISKFVGGIRHTRNIACIRFAERIPTRRRYKTCSPSRE